MVFKVIWYLVSLTFLNNFLCIQTWILTKASWNKTRNSSCSVSGVCCELTVHEVCRKCSNSITNILHLFKIILQTESFSEAWVRSDVGLLAQSLHTLYVVLHGGAVCDLSGTVGRKPAPLTISHPFSMTPAYSKTETHTFSKLLSKAT